MNIGVDAPNIQKHLSPVGLLRIIHMEKKEEMEKLKLAKLYKTSSIGKELEWEISVIDNRGNATIRTIHGQVGGQLQTTDLLIKSGKNIGKSNETTPLEQAYSEAESKWKKQIDKGYAKNRGGSSRALSPMLAHNYDDHKKKVTFPSYVQAKLDGIRCISVYQDGQISLKSRQGKEFLGLGHIREALLSVMNEGEVWDGELYNPDLSFQEIVSLVKKEQPKSKLIEYHVYDSIDNSSFRERYSALKHDKERLVNKVPTYKVESHDGVMDYHTKFVAAGYEGAILRVGDCPYKAGNRSDKLLKIKSWKDAEFRIVDVVPDVHGTQGIFICVTNEGATFEVRIVGENSEREYILSNKNKYLGKLLTVKYFSFTTSENAVPRFPVGLKIKEDFE